jgi:hypothetical protein
MEHITDTHIISSITKDTHYYINGKEVDAATSLVFVNNSIAKGISPMNIGSIIKKVIDNVPVALILL